MLHATHKFVYDSDWKKNDEHPNRMLKGNILGEIVKLLILCFYSLIDTILVLTLMNKNI